MITIIIMVHVAYLNYVLLTGRGDIMECLPSLHLPINGSGRGVAGSSVQ